MNQISLLCGIILLHIAKYMWGLSMLLYVQVVEVCANWIFGCSTINHNVPIDRRRIQSYFKLLGANFHVNLSSPFLFLLSKCLGVWCGATAKGLFSYVGGCLLFSSGCVLLDLDLHQQCKNLSCLESSWEFDITPVWLCHLFSTCSSIGWDMMLCTSDALLFGT